MDLLAKILEYFKGADSLSQIALIWAALVGLVGSVKTLLAIVAPLTDTKLDDKALVFSPKSTTSAPNSPTTSPTNMFEGEFPETSYEWGERFDAALDVAGKDWPEMCEQLRVELMFIQDWAYEHSD